MVWPLIAAVAAPLVASAISSIVSGSGDDDARAANNDKLRAMTRASSDTGLYRGQIGAAQMQSLANRMQAYQPAMDAMATMYGSSAGRAPEIGLGPDALGLPKGTLMGPPTGAAAPMSPNALGGRPQTPGPSPGPAPPQGAGGGLTMLDYYRFLNGGGGAKP